MARKKELLTGAVIVLALIVAFFGWRYYSTRQNPRLRRTGRCYHHVQESGDQIGPNAERRSLKHRSLNDYPSAGPLIARYYLALAL
jgi:predicted negative regulator of RcsB-dependent stress response